MSGSQTSKGEAMFIGAAKEDNRHRHGLSGEHFNNSARTTGFNTQIIVLVHTSVISVAWSK